MYENEQFLAAGVHESGYFTRRQTEIAILPAPSPSHSFSVPRFPLMQIWGGLMKILEIACDNFPKRFGSAGTLIFARSIQVFGYYRERVTKFTVLKSSYVGV